MWTGCLYTRIWCTLEADWRTNKWIEPTSAIGHLNLAIFCSDLHNQSNLSVKYCWGLHLLAISNDRNTTNSVHILIWSLWCVGGFARKATTKAGKSSSRLSCYVLQVIIRRPQIGSIVDIFAVRIWVHGIHQHHRNVFQVDWCRWFCKKSTDLLTIPKCSESAKTRFWTVEVTIDRDGCKSSKLYLFAS